MTIHLGSFFAGLISGILATLIFAVICGLALNVAALRGPRPAPKDRPKPFAPPPPPPRKDRVIPPPPLPPPAPPRPEAARIELGIDATIELERIRRSVERGEWE